MIVALLWLTASAPFMVGVKKDIKKMGVSLADIEKQAVEDADNPYAGLNEEQCNGNASFSEYLHENVYVGPCIVQPIKHSCFMSRSIYIAYYGELLSPPPEA